MFNERFNEPALRCIKEALGAAQQYGYPKIGSALLMVGVMREETNSVASMIRQKFIGARLLENNLEEVLGKPPGVAPKEIDLSEDGSGVAAKSVEVQRATKSAMIGPEHLVLAMLDNPRSEGARLLKEVNIDTERLARDLLLLLEQKSATRLLPPGPGSQSGKSELPTLLEYGIDLTQKAQDGKLDPVIGREDEIERIIQVLSRRRKNNPVLIGEPGVGKTAIAEGLAQRIINEDVPEALLGKRIINLPLGTLTADTMYRGQFEERIRKILKELKTQKGKAIVFIDELHMVLGAGAAIGGLDMANLIKPALSRGEMTCIGATTLAEYRKYIESDAALERRFQPVVVSEPSVDQTIRILEGLAPGLQAHHGVLIDFGALACAALRSDQLIQDRFLPDKAIDLVDEACSRAKVRAGRPAPRIAAIIERFKEYQRAVVAKDYVLANSLQASLCHLVSQAEKLVPAPESSTEKVNVRKCVDSFQASGFIPIVTSEDIELILKEQTGIDIGHLSFDAAQKLVNIESQLGQTIIGQSQAVSAVARALRRNRTGLRDPDRPIGSFIFSGPTGVGKTELAKQLARYLFGTDEAMIRLDMSEYMERHEVSKLIGAPPGYVGYDQPGLLTEAVRRRPYAVVLFDEIEKAHPDVFNLLLQILEDGRLTDAKGRTVDFNNTLIIMTSNIGSGAMQKGRMGFATESAETETLEAVKQAVNEALKQSFRPEFLNRIDEIIVFLQLSKANISEIAGLLCNEIENLLWSKHEIRLTITDAAMELFMRTGYKPEYGARELRREIQRLLVDDTGALAEAILNKRFSRGDAIVADVDPDRPDRITLSRAAA